MPNHRDGATLETLVSRLVLYTYQFFPTGSDPRGEAACQYVVEAWEELLLEEDLEFQDEKRLFELLCSMIRRHVDADALPRSAM
jgi:hypothetical protein